MEYDELDDLYRGVILDHNRNPRNHGVLDHADAEAHAVNPFCGDEVRLQTSLEGGRVARVGVQAVGCSINRAAASLLSEAVKGRAVEEAEALSKLFRRTLASDDPPDADGLGALTSLTGVRRFPVRVKCALLAWNALEDTLADLEGPAAQNE